MTRCRSLGTSSLWYVAFALAAAGCGGGGGSAPVGPFSCVASLPGSDGGMATEVLCLDVTGGTEQDLEKNRQSCSGQGNALERQPCSHTNALGGCRVSRGGVTITTWYYATSPSDDSAPIRELCAGLGVLYVAP